MKRIYNKETGKLTEVRLTRSEQLMLMKHNIAKLHRQGLNNVVNINAKVSER